LSSAVTFLWRPYADVVLQRAETGSSGGEVVGMVAFKTLTATGFSRLVKVFTTLEIRIDSPRRRVK